jgi:hypothetical protein
MRAGATEMAEDSVVIDSLLDAAKLAYEPGLRRFQIFL